MKHFDITMTATLRPELIRKTLESFNKYLFGKYVDKARLIINIDMIGSDDPKTSRQEIRQLLSEQSYRGFKLRESYEPNFPTAWQWCMGQTESEYIFNLEEDWELLYPMGFEQMVRIMDTDPTLAHLRLSQFRSTERSLKAWQNHAYWNGRFFEYRDGMKQVDGWCGHPSINRKSFLDRAISYMDPTKNPEKQIKGRQSIEMQNLIHCHDFGIFHFQDHGPAIKDLGRDWMTAHGYRKAGNKAWFENWEVVR